MTKEELKKDMWYLVTLTDGEILQLVTCKSAKEVSNLLLGLKKEFSLVRIECLGDNVYDDYKEFVQIDEKIEFGKREEK